MTLDFFKTEAARLAPQIVYAYREFEGLDDPDRIRWRAAWHRDWNTGLPVGIEMTPYPVARKTRCGVWVDPHACRQATRQPWEDGAPGIEWVLSDKNLWKFVHDGSGSAWAKPTRAAALRSLGIRLCRWSAAVRRDVARVNAACDVAEALLTTDSWKDTAEHALFYRDGGGRGSAAGHKIVLADEETDLGVALRRLRYRHRNGGVRAEDIEVVVAAMEA